MDGGSGGGMFVKMGFVRATRKKMGREKNNLARGGEIILDLQVRTDGRTDIIP